MTCLKGRIFKGSCRGRHIGPLKIHNMSLPGKVAQIPPLVAWKEYISMQDHCSADSRFIFLNLWRMPTLSVPTVKGCHSTLNCVLSLAGTGLSTNRIISRMFISFIKICPPREVKPVEWILFIVLKILTHPPFEP